MAIITLAQIKTYFETGDFPTQQEFSDTWDSLRHQLDGYVYAGAVGLSDSPTSITKQIFVFPYEAGQYSNFGNLVVNRGEIAAFKLTINHNTGFGTWTKDIIKNVSELYSATFDDTDVSSGILSITLDNTRPLTAYITMLDGNCMQFNVKRISATQVDVNIGEALPAGNYTIDLIYL